MSPGSVILTVGAPYTCTPHIETAFLRSPRARARHALRIPPSATPTYGRWTRCWYQVRGPKARALCVCRCLPASPPPPAQPSPSLSPSTRSLGAWEAADFPDPSAYTTTLSPAMVAELDAMAAFVPPGTPIHAVALTPTLRALAPALGPLLQAVAAEVRSGRGFALLRGLPVPATRPGMSAWDVTLRYWLVGAFFGAARPNTQAGHLVGHIKDIGHDPDHPNTRLCVACRCYGFGAAPSVAPCCASHQATQAQRKKTQKHAHTPFSSALPTTT